MYYNFLHQTSLRPNFSKVPNFEKEEIHPRCPMVKNSRICDYRTGTLKKFADLRLAG